MDKFSMEIMALVEEASKQPDIQKLVVRTMLLGCQPHKMFSRHGWDRTDNVLSEYSLNLIYGHHEFMLKSVPIWELPGAVRLLLEKISDRVIFKMEK